MEPMEIEEIYREEWAPPPRALTITVLGDELLAGDAFDSWKDPNERRVEKEIHLIAPHVVIKTDRMGHHPMDTAWIYNVSRGRLSLEKLLCRQFIGSWLDQWQDMTVLQLGAQDLIQGLLSKEIALKDPKVWERAIKTTTQRMVELKEARFNETGRHDFQDWFQGHTFAVYVLPDLSGRNFDETFLSNIEYFHIRRANVKMWRRNRDAHFYGIKILKPALEHPEFEDGHYASPFQEKYIEPVLRLVGELYCTRCRTPLLAKDRWEDCVLSPDQGQPTALHYLPILCWGKIFSLLGVIDTWACKLTCLGLYRIHHVLRLRCKRRFCTEAERVMQLLPE